MPERHVRREDGKSIVFARQPVHLAGAQELLVGLLHGGLARPRPSAERQLEIIAPRDEYGWRQTLFAADEQEIPPQKRIDQLCLSRVEIPYEHSRRGRQYLRFQKEAHICSSSFYSVASGTHIGPALRPESML